MDFRVRTAERKDLGAVLAVETASKREVGREYLAGELQNPLCCFYLVESQPKGKVCAYLLAGSSMRTILKFTTWLRCRI
jgi:hypothetical protein